MNVARASLSPSPVVLVAGVVAGLLAWAALAVSGGTGARVWVPIVAAAFAAFVVAWIERERRDTAGAAVAREAVDGERATMQALLERLPIGILVIDVASGRTVRANHEARRLLEQPLAPGSVASTVLDGSAFRDADGHPADPLELLVARALATGTTVFEDLDVSRGDGARLNVRVAASAIPDGPSPHPQGLLLFSDVTGLRETEAQLSRSHRFDALGALAAGMAHNLGNQLTGVVCYLELLTAAPDLSSSARNQVDEAMACANLAADQTRSLVIAAAKIELNVTAPPNAAPK